MTRSSRPGTQGTIFTCLPLHSTGGHGGIRGSTDVSDWDGIMTRGTGRTGTGTRGIGIHGIGTLGTGIRGIMHRTGATDITGTTIITTGTETAIREESGTEDATCTTVRGTPPVHTAPEHQPFPGMPPFREMPQAHPFPEGPRQEYPGVHLPEYPGTHPA